MSYGIPDDREPPKKPHRTVAYDHDAKGASSATSLRMIDPSQKFTKCKRIPQATARNLRGKGHWANGPQRSFSEPPRGGAGLPVTAFLAKYGNEDVDSGWDNRFPDISVPQRVQPPDISVPKIENKSTQGAPFSNLRTALGSSVTNHMR